MAIAFIKEFWCYIIICLGQTTLHSMMLNFFIEQYYSGVNLVLNLGVVDSWNFG